MITSIISAKGSCGGTTILVLLACKISKYKKVLLIDANKIKSLDIILSTDNIITEVLDENFTNDYNNETTNDAKEEYFNNILSSFKRKYISSSKYNENIELLNLKDLSIIKKEELIKVLELLENEYEILIDVSSSEWQNNLEDIYRISKNVIVVSTEESVNLRAMDSLFNNYNNISRNFEFSENKDLLFIINKCGLIEDFDEDSLFDFTENYYIGNFKFNNKLSNITDSGKLVQYFDDMISSEYNDVEGYIDLDSSFNLFNDFLENKLKVMIDSNSKTFNMNNNANENTDENAYQNIDDINKSISPINDKIISDIVLEDFHNEMDESIDTKIKNNVNDEEMNSKKGIIKNIISFFKR